MESYMVANNVKVIYELRNWKTVAPVKLLFIGVLPFKPYGDRVHTVTNCISWWYHGMETFSELLALCERNPHYSACAAGVE